MQTQLQKTKRELKIQNYSRETIKTYLYSLQQYFIFKKHDFTKLNSENIKNFLLAQQKRQISAQSRNLFLSAIKFYYQSVVKNPQKIEIKTAKKSKKLPIVLSKKEIGKILQSLKNTKHKLLLSLAYGAGLRVSEVVSLKIQDINLEEKTIHLKQTKSQKDRITILPQKLTEELQNLFAGKTINDFVFAGKQGGKLTTRSAQKIFKKALQLSGIKKNAGFHSLRHSFATHLLENGINVRYIQELLGHQNIRTTQRYTQVTNPKLKDIKSPLL